MKQYFGIISIIIAAIIFISFINKPTQWEVPEKYQKMKNPVKPTASSIKIGKDMYKRYCTSCHGNTGMGEGPKAVKLNKTCGNFTTDAFKKETDGAVFYKMTEGHDDMPSFKKKIPSNDDIIEGSFGETGSVGDLINYIRTLANK